MRDKQAAINALLDILKDREALERKINAFLREQCLNEIDAPYGIVSALGRLGHVKDDIHNALSEIGASDEQLQQHSGEHI